MLAWRYIDKLAATIAVLRDYGNMKNVIKITPDDMKEVHARMVSPKTPRLTGMPKVQRAHSSDDRLAASLDQLDVMQERFEQAVEYMAWFEPAWESLGDEEREVLREYYMGDNLRSGAAARLQIKLNYSDRQIERLRHKALGHLSALMFGK